MRGSGTTKGYAVEARSTHSRPEVVSGQIFDERWQRIKFATVPPQFGVRRGDPSESHWLALCGLYSWKSANALLWWFLAQINDDWFIETRIVEHKITWEYTQDNEGRVVSEIGAEQHKRPPKVEEATP